MKYRLILFLVLSATIGMDSQLNASDIPRHPCDDGQGIRYQTSNLGPCFDLSSQIQKVLSQKNIVVPEDLPGLVAIGTRPPFSLMKRNLYFADFNQVVLHNVFLDSSILDWSNFTGILAWHSRWLGASMRNANLTGAKLFAADFQNADLQSAKLIYADLSFADLRLSDLHAADLTSANVRGARFEGAIYSSSTKLPFSEERAQALGMEKIDAESP